MIRLNIIIINKSADFYFFIIQIESQKNPYSKIDVLIDSRFIL